MKATDDQSYQPRRFRAEVRRLKDPKASAAEPAVEPVQPEEAPPAVDSKEPDAIAQGERASASEHEHTAVLPKDDEPELAIKGIGDADYVDETAVMPKESFDYVVPTETFKQHHSRRRHSSTHSGTTKSASKEDMENAEEGYIFTTHRKRRKHRKHRYHKFRHLALWKRILIITGIVLLALIVVLTGTFFTLHEIGRRGMLTLGDAEVGNIPSEDESGREIVQADKNGHVITYDGVSYELNKDLMSVVFIGADEGEGENAHLRMSDAIYILTVDTKTGKVKILGISRDTMADVDLYSEQGNYIDTQKMQMAFAYAYGNEQVTGGKNTTLALQRLFYGLPFDNYFAINMDALVTLNDTIGGVTLTSSMTFTSPIDGRTINKGDTVTLHGKEAEEYVRHRDTEVLGSNADRMQRQQEYIRAFLGSIVPTAKKDISMVTDLYNEIKVNSDTTLGASKMTYIASTALTKMRNASDIEYVTLKGTITEGEYAELNVTNEDTIRTMLDVFYKPLAKTPGAD